MDWITIVGLLGTLISFEEVGRGLFSGIKKKLAGRKIRLCNWDSDDPVTQFLLDSFKSKAYAEYREHIFSESEIDEIAKKFLTEKEYLRLSRVEAKKIARYIKNILDKYNKYTYSKMSVGEKVVYDKMNYDHNEIKEKLLDVANKESNQNYLRFLQVVEESKSVGLGNIESLINGEYKIDRSKFVENVKSADEKFVTIYGCAGSGKSVLAKQIVLDEEYVVYARAERFTEEKNLENIWQCNLDDVLEQISEKRVVFFIDALEFIADCACEKIELLQSLYNTASKFSNAHVIATCRTEDRNTFLKLETQFSVATYELDDISEIELNGICAKYPVINKLKEEKTYVDLLRSPFYVNLIISKIPEERDIQNESTFREYIWKNVICLGKKCSKYRLKPTDVKDTVEKIVFTRAENFLVGVHCSEFSDDILQVLLIEGIVVRKGQYVRLKYDIFEDICFEQHFDKCFDLCKGEFSAFFIEIQKLGRCVYRRYQIWISNKLFLRSNLEKFIYALFFDKTITSEWKNQTEIGIVKSKYCTTFFEAYFLKLVKEEYIGEIIRITNLYAFEARIMTKNIGQAFLRVTPIGNARESLLVLLAENWIDIKTKLNKVDIIKLCDDYANQKNRCKSASNAACKIIESYIDEEKLENRKSCYKTWISLLRILYIMADASKEWIEQFFGKLQGYCSGDEAEKQQFAYEIIEETLKNANPMLIRQVPYVICDLANRLWFKGNGKGGRLRGQFEHDLREENAYGLSQYAEHISMTDKGVIENIFLWNILTVNFYVGFEWAINFVNQTISNYVDNNPDGIMLIQIYFADERSTKKYYGNHNLWLAGIQEYNVPMLIGDVIYVLKKILINNIRRSIKEGICVQEFAEYVKKEIYEKANNIALLSIVEAIGFNFQTELPGYALDLSSCFELIYWDIHRYSLLSDNPTRELLERQLLRTVGISSLSKRYEKGEENNIILQQYVVNMQLSGKEEVRNKCIQICDYLYSKVKNEGEEAHLYLQIQKMDLRNATLKKVAEDIYAIEPNVTGEAKEIVRNNEETAINKLGKQIEKLLEEGKGIVCGDKPNYEKLDEVIKLILEMVERDEVVKIHYDNVLIQLIGFALGNKKMATERRDQLLSIWLDGVSQDLNKGFFTTDDKSFFILLEQLNENCSLNIKHRIKELILESLLDSKNKGLVSRFSNQTKLYLRKDSVRANILFNTIIMLAKDEMMHQIYNMKYLKASGREDGYKFIPNKQPKLAGVDYWIQEEGDIPYTSEKDIIIEKYLWDEAELQEADYKMEDYDIEILCYVSNCGLTLENEKFSTIMRSIIICLIELWDFDRGEHNAYRIVDANAEFEVMQLFWRELIENDVNSYKAIDILFDEIDFSLFTYKTIEFYQEILGRFLCAYFDAYSEKGKRKIIEDKIKYLEKKVHGISDRNVQIQLYKSLFFALTQYCHGDWSKAKTSYEYEDKMFLNNQFGKYGKYHVKDVMQTIYQLRIEELLPEILLAVSKVFNDAAMVNEKMFRKEVLEVQWIVDYLILKAFIDKSDEIKADLELTNAFESVLLSMIELNDSKAAVILDEFRIH